MNYSTIHRRELIKGAAASVMLAGIRHSGIEKFLPGRQYRVALIGTGWYGKSDLFRLMQVTDAEVVALCDVDRNQLAEAGKMVSARIKTGRSPRLYADYRKMLAETKPEIVLIGTPDHWHALTAIDSMKAGAHVYVQKPISVDVLEGEAMVEAAREYNRVVQVGTQRRSTPHFVDAKRNIIDAGLLGKISHVEICCYYHMRNSNNPPLQQVPAFLDYDAWTGPAPLRAYDGLPHVGWWRAFMAYGNGIMGDMGIHMFDAVRWMLGLGWPRRVSSTGGIYMDNPGKSDISDTQSALFEYEGLNCVWEHRSWGSPADPEYPWALKIFGSNGTLMADVYKYDFIPVEKGERIHKDVVYEREKYPEDLTEPKIELHCAPATRAHIIDFLNAIETKSLPVAGIGQGHISTASCILANMSMKLGRPLVYDPVKRIVTGDEEATMLLRRPYRKGWDHPF